MSVAKPITSVLFFLLCLLPVTLSGYPSVEEKSERKDMLFRNEVLPETSVKDTVSGLSKKKPKDPTDATAPSVNWMAGGSWATTTEFGTTQKNWSAVSISGDGNKGLACTSAPGGRIYMYNSGIWTETQPAGNTDKSWTSVSVSGDGNTMLAAVFGGRLYKYSSGAWTETRPGGDTDKNWISVAVSSDGSVMLAAVSNGRVYKYSQGAWAEVTPAGNVDKNWLSIAVSPDGNKILAGEFWGRLYLYSNGSWSETRPAGDVNKYWEAVSLSADGSKMLAAASGGRLYYFKNNAWAETQPSTPNNFSWNTVSLSSDGSKMITGNGDGNLYVRSAGNDYWESVYPGPFVAKNWIATMSSDGGKIIAAQNDGVLYLFTREETSFDIFTVDGCINECRLKANITSNNGSASLSRGFIYYPYTNSDKIIGDPGLMNYFDVGSFDIGEFGLRIYLLIPNTHYNIRAYAVNAAGTGYSARRDFWTHATKPGAPTLTNRAATTLQLTLNNLNGNPDATEFAIREFETGKYVQSDGTLGLNAVWQTATVWGTKTITGLTDGKIYYFAAKARNGVNIESGFGSAASSAAPVVSVSRLVTERTGTQYDDFNSLAASYDGSVMLAAAYGNLHLYSNGSWSTTSPTGNNDEMWECVAVSGDGNKMLAGIDDGRLYLYSNGVWSETQPAGNINKKWKSLAISTDGTKMMASVSAGRVYYYNNGSWTETQPAGNVDKNWQSVSFSSDGNIRIAASLGGLYWFRNGSWSELQLPATNYKQWSTVAVSSDGSVMIACEYNGGAYWYKDGNWSPIPVADLDVAKEWIGASISDDGSSMLVFSKNGKLYYYSNNTWLVYPGSISTRAGVVSGNGTGLIVRNSDGLQVSRNYTGLGNSATSYYIFAQILAANGDNTGEYGILYYPFTDTDKIIGDEGTDFKNKSDTLRTGIFSFLLSPLTPNTRYNYRAFATSSNGTGYSLRNDFWTLANIPAPPVLFNSSATTIDLLIDVNGNPIYTEFAIQDSLSGSFVQADGTLGVTAIWQTPAEWDTITTTGLVNSTNYHFRVKARNENNMETDYGIASVLRTPVVNLNIGNTLTEIFPAGNVNLSWTKAAISADGSKILVSGGNFGSVNKRLYLYSEGVWTETQPAGNVEKNWSCLSMSDDGNKMLAGISDGRLYLYNGGSWTEVQPAGNYNNNWKSLAVSADGSAMLAGAYGGRLYLYRHGVWTETRPDGDVNKNWSAVAVSSDGSKMLTGVNGGRLYMCNNGVWAETQPKGAVNTNWSSVAVSSDGQIMLAVENPGIHYRYQYSIYYNNWVWSPVSPGETTDHESWKSVSLSSDGAYAVALNGQQLGFYFSNNKTSIWSRVLNSGANSKIITDIAMSSDGSRIVLATDFSLYFCSGVQIATNSATCFGNIATTGSSEVTVRGIIYYPYVGYGKVMGNPDVINLFEDGSFGTGAFYFDIPSLQHNARYTYNAYATNIKGTSYSSMSHFWTRAYAPAIPALTNPTVNTMDITIDVNLNPSVTEYAIQDSISGKYVQANGSLADFAVWQLESTWGTKTINGLTPGVTYYFRVKARNGSHLETGYSPAVPVTPSGPPFAVFIDTEWEETQPAGNDNKNWTSVALSADGSKGIACVKSWGVYTLNNGTWTSNSPPLSSTLSFQSVAISGDGNTMMVCVNPGRIFIYRNGSWTETRPNGNYDFNWNALAISHDGNSMLAAVTGGQVFVYQNGAWSLTYPAGYSNYQWQSVSISADGSKMLAAYTGNFGGRIYLYNNGSWAETQPAGNISKRWQSVSVSADGSRMMAAEGYQDAYFTDGHVYLYSNGAWAETKPAGNVAKYWKSVSLSVDGSKMLAAINGGRLYMFDIDAWNEVQPAGNTNQLWNCVSVSSQGNKMLAGSVRLYEGTGGIQVSDQSALLKGEHTTNGSLVNERGFIYYPYTDTDKIKGDAGVADSSQTGSFDAGAYEITLNALTANTHYNARAFANNSSGTGYSPRTDFWTLALPPPAPNLINPTISSLDLVVSPGNNPENTEFAIQDSISGKYLQADGTTGNSTLWQTAAIWDNITISGLTAGTRYYYRVKARNGSLYETAFGPAASAIPSEVPEVELLADGLGWTELQPAGNVLRSWAALTVSADGSKILAAATSGRLYMFENGAWAETKPAGNVTAGWQSVSMSADGSIMLACALPGRLYLYSSGSWTEIQPAGDADLWWSSVSVSADGSTMLASVAFGRLYLYKNGSWAETQPAGNSNYLWFPSSVSGDGSRMLAGIYGGRLFMFSNNSWAETQPAGDVDVVWSSVSISGDGSKMLAGSNTEGRLYTFSGDLWNEAQPAGNVDQKWQSVSVSLDGNTMIAGANGGRLYISQNGTWSETQPAGNTDVSWLSVGTTADGKTLYAGSSHKLYKGFEREPANEITPTSAVCIGNITATNGANASSRGIIYYPFTNTDKIIGDAGVSQSGENGTFETGMYTTLLNNLTANNHYNIRAFASNSAGNGYSSTYDFWTHAHVPLPPAVHNCTTNSLDVTINSTGNPEYTLFAIQDSVNGLFVQADGTRAASEVWQTAATWNTITITGLNPGINYYFRVKAKNELGIETEFGLSAKPYGGIIGSNQNICYGNVPESFTNVEGALIYGGIPEYKWQYSTVGITDGFTDIANSNSPGYAPVALTVDTWFRRLARENCMVNWNRAASSNVVKVSIYSLIVISDSATEITETSATGNGNIPCGVNITNRGMIWYEYTGTNKISGEAGVTDVSQSGSFGQVPFTASFTGLSVNTRYNARAHATNDAGTVYGSRLDFWTLANVPLAPAVNSPAVTSLNLTINVNGNPAATLFAIQETTTGQYVQANGALGANSVWQSNTAWGTKTVTGLTSGTTYTFRTQARNGNNIETAFGTTASLATLSNNASLAGLETSCGALVPDFSASITSYTIQVPYSASSTTITATTAHTGATLTIAGNNATSGSAYGPVNLNVGTNNISTVVTAQDGVTKKTYTIQINRAVNTPTVQATGITTSHLSSHSVKIDWTRGNGEACRVFMKASNTGNAAPVDNTAYSANAVFPAGNQIGNSGWYCVYDGAGNSVTVSGLNANTDYRIHVCEYNTGSVYYNSGTLSDNPVTFETKAIIEVAATLGTPTGKYNTLGDAFAMINLGMHNGQIIIEVNGNSTETYTAVLNASGTESADYTSVLLYPAVTGLTISGNFSAPLISLNGADNVTIDGRVNATGSDKDLTISNTATSSASTIRFINDACTNTVQYCVLKGSTTSYGILYFSGTDVLSGNDNNTVINNDITRAHNSNRPVSAVYSMGTANKMNSNNNFSNNQIYDFFNRSLDSYGINLADYNTDWTISGNSFFETTAFLSTAAVSYTVINISYSAGMGNNFNVTGNYIGGSSANVGGIWSKSGQNTPFTGISVKAGTEVASNIQGNYISDFSFSNAGSAEWYGIRILKGNVHVGTSAGNNIGSAEKAGSIIFTAGASVSGFYGIACGSADTVSIHNNIIGGITATNSNTGDATNFYGISILQPGITTITNNTIGSLTTDNSIVAESASTAAEQSVFGIQNISGGNVTISGNTIANLANETANTTKSTAGRIAGISLSNGACSVLDNTIQNLTIANAFHDVTDYLPSAGGIVISGVSSNQLIKGNTIYNLSNTYDTFDGFVTGIYCNTSGTAQFTISENFIHHLSINGAGITASFINGITVQQGGSSIFNNIVSLGGNSLSTVCGIIDYDNISSATCYFNTVYISGQPALGSNPSYSVYFRADNPAGKVIKNNLLINKRSTPGSHDLHYALYHAGLPPASPGLTIYQTDFNVYYASGTGSVLAYIGGHQCTLSQIQAASGSDVNSLNTDPEFNNPGSTEANGYFPTNKQLKSGITIPGIISDFGGVTVRTSSPTLGAWELSCENPTSGGIIASDQTICQGDIPSEISSTSLPSGHTGDLEFKWQISTTSSLSGFTDISGATDTTWQPGPINDTTWVRRLARVSCKTSWEGCDTSNIVQIIIEPSPVSGILSKTPDQDTVCQGVDVEAGLTAGSGGSGTDSTCYRTRSSAGWSEWTTYTSGSEISTTGKTEVEVRTKRNAVYCTDAPWTVVSWLMEPAPVSGALSKIPDQANVCEGDKVSAALTAGSGGDGTDSTYYRTKTSSGWSSWLAYTSGSDISTTEITDVEIRTKRKASYCSDDSWTMVSWAVEQTPVTGILAGSPDADLICQGDEVSAILTPGSGGNGIDSLVYRTQSGMEWSDWQTYISGSDITTGMVTQIEIQTLRKADYCADDEADIVGWSVDKTPPDVTEKSNVSVTLDPSGLYTLLSDDLLESYTDGGAGIQSVDIEPETVTCPDVGSKSIKVTVSDNCYNQTVVNMIITVVENTGLGDWENCNTHINANGTSAYSACTNNGTFYLTSKGKGSSTGDVMHFVYKPLTGNGTIIARLADVKNDGWAGVMMRESCVPGAKAVLFKTRLYNPNVLIGYRSNTNKAITNVSQVYQQIRWLKIQRNGNTFLVYVSYNGTNWTKAYTTTIAMTGTIMAGIFTENSLINRTTQAWFSHVEMVTGLKSGFETSNEDFISQTDSHEIQIYPNPASQQVTITLSEFDPFHIGTHSIDAAMISSDGKIIKQISIKDFKTILDLDGITPGWYMIRFENEKWSVIKRLVIQ